MGYGSLMLSVLVCLGCSMLPGVWSDVTAEGYHIALADGLTLTRPDGQAMVISLHELTETDLMGNPVHIPGHSVTQGDFEAVNLTMSDPCTRTVRHSDQVSSIYFYFTAELPMIAPHAQLSVEVFFLTSRGNVVNHHELTRVYPNDVKLTVTVMGWPWCRGCPGQDGGSVDGAYLDLTLGLQLPPGGTPQDRNVSRNLARIYDLGNDMKISLSRKVNADDHWSTMDGDFPVVEMGPHDVHSIKLRLPQFHHMALYDPIISLNVSDRDPRVPEGPGGDVQCSGMSPVQPPYSSVARGIHGNAAAAISIVMATYAWSTGSTLS